MQGGNARRKRWTAYYLQAFRQDENVLAAPETVQYSAYSAQDMGEMADIARKYIDKVILRGVE